MPHSSATQVAPLADRMRPQSLGGFVGQAHLLGPSKPLRAAMLSIPDDPNLADQTLVIANAPDHLLFVAMAWPMRLLEGMTMPQRIRALGTQGVAIEITRVDERTLKIGFDGRPHSSVIDWLFRRPDPSQRARSWSSTA